MAGRPANETIKTVRADVNEVKADVASVKADVNEVKSNIKELASGVAEMLELARGKAPAPTATSGNAATLTEAPAPPKASAPLADLVVRFSGKTFQVPCVRDVGVERRERSDKFGNRYVDEINHSIRKYELADKASNTYIVIKALVANPQQV